MFCPILFAVESFIKNQEPRVSEVLDFYEGLLDLLRHLWGTYNQHRTHGFDDEFTRDTSH